MVFNPKPSNVDEVFDQLIGHNGIDNYAEISAMRNALHTVFQPIVPKAPITSQDEDITENKEFYDAIAYLKNQ